MKFQSSNSFSLATASFLFFSTTIVTQASTLPISSTGSLGSLNASTGEILFNTDTGIYYVNGIAQNDISNRRAVLLPANSGGIEHPEVYIPVFDFTSINIASSANVRVEGKSPLTLLASNSANIAGTFLLNGIAGQDGGLGAGGGGGSGGGALAIFSAGSLDFIGSIFANGGNGGTSDIISQNESGGIGGQGVAGGGDGGNGGEPLAGGKGGNGGTGVVLGVKTQWVEAGIPLGGGGGGGGGAYNGMPGNGAATAGEPGDFGERGKCCERKLGGKGGKGGGFKGTAGGDGGTPNFGDEAPRDGKKGNNAGGGGGGAGGNAPAGSVGGRGGPGGNLGGGGGGGGGGGDKCCSKGKGGAGGPGGPGGGGGSEGESGKPGQLIKTLSSDTPSGGGGGGGRVILGSAIDDIFYNGVIETFGGTSTTSIGGGGVLTFVSSQNVELGSNALFNGFLPLSGADVGSYLISDLPLEDYVLVGGGAGAGAGGYGQAQDDPCCVPEPSTIMGLLAFGTLGAASTLKRKLKSSKLTEKETTKVS